MSEEVTVKIRKLGVGGAFLGEVTDGPANKIGKKAFVNFVAPEEIVKINIEKEEKKLIFGSSKEIIQESPFRNKPPCKYFSVCGGCDLQHITIEKQRELKLEMISEMLSKHTSLSNIPKVKNLSEKLPSLGYRRRIALHVSDSSSIGFYKKGTGDIVDVESCLVCTESINRTITEIRSNLKIISTSISKIIIEDRDGTPYVLMIQREGSPRLPKEQIEKIQKTIPNLSIDSGIGNKITKEDRQSETLGHFSQVNELANKVLVDYTVSKVTSESLTELYSGSGNFTLPLLYEGKKVLAVEIDSKLTNECKRIASNIGCSELLTIHNLSVERFLKGNKISDTVLLDPPRDGAKVFVEKVDAALVSTIIYVSCSLPTLCRDIRTLASKGYQLDSISFVDMFPQTHFVETISVLKNLEAD